MKRTIFICLLCLVAVLAQAQSEPQHEVELVTDSGTIVLALYNDTPKHRDNFLKQVRSGAYNGVLFHRVIKDFMVQTGDLASKTAKPGQQLGDTPEAYLPKFVFLSTTINEAHWQPHARAITLIPKEHHRLHSFTLFGDKSLPTSSWNGRKAE